MNRSKEGIGLPRQAHSFIRTEVLWSDMTMAQVLFCFVPVFELPEPGRKMRRVLRLYAFALAPVPIFFLFIWLYSVHRIIFWCFLHTGCLQSAGWSYTDVLPGVCPLDHAKKEPSKSTQQLPCTCPSVQATTHTSTVNQGCLAVTWPRLMRSLAHSRKLQECWTLGWRDGSLE